jgi:hypothetical protein
LSCSEGLFGSAQLYHGALSASARCVCRYKGPGWFAYRAWNGMCYAEGSEKGSNTKYHPGSIVTHELDMEEGGGRPQADIPMLVEAPFAISVGGQGVSATAQVVALLLAPAGVHVLSELSFLVDGERQPVKIPVPKDRPLYPGFIVCVA